MAALDLDFGEVAFSPDVYKRNNQSGEAETNTDAEKSKAGDAFRETVCVCEDECVAVKEGEEDDVDDRKI